MLEHCLVELNSFITPVKFKSPKSVLPVSNQVCFYGDTIWFSVMEMTNLFICHTKHWNSLISELPHGEKPSGTHYICYIYTKARATLKDKFTQKWKLS